MRTLAAALLCGMLITGCGGTKVRTVVKTVSPSATTPTTTQATSTTSSQDCDAKGINSKILNEGTCIDSGVRLVVVNRASELRLPTLAARVDGIRIADSVSSDYDSATPHGVFAIVTLTVRNRSNTPQEFASAGARQTILTIGDREFSEAFDAENGPDQRSFLSIDDNTIQPGNSLTGEIIFDVPRSDAAKIDRDGRLDVLNFGDDARYGDVKELGQIRLYH